MLLLKIERGVWGLQALVSPFGFRRSVLYLNVCGRSLVPSGLKGPGLSNACMGPGSACRHWCLRLPCWNTGADPGLVGVVGGGVSGQGGSSTHGAVTCLTLQAWCLHSIRDWKPVPDLGLLVPETPFGTPLCVFRHVNRSQSTLGCLDFIVCRAAVCTPNLRLRVSPTTTFPHHCMNKRFKRCLKQNSPQLKHPPSQAYAWSNLRWSRCYLWLKWKLWQSRKGEARAEFLHHTTARLCVHRPTL